MRRAQARLMLPSSTSAKGRCKCLLLMLSADTALLGAVAATCTVFGLGHPAAVPARVLPSRWTGRSRTSFLWSFFTILCWRRAPHPVTRLSCQLCSQQVPQRQWHRALPSPDAFPCLLTWDTESLTPLPAAVIPVYLTITWMLLNLGLFCTLLPS